MPSKKRESLHLDKNSTDRVEPNHLFAVERDEIVKLTKIAKSWDFVCSFCFKKFPSAQAMGGHQNAHRNERLEEKRLFVRDPIGYRKRAYLRALKKAQLSAKNQLHADAVDKNNNNTSRSTVTPNPEPKKNDVVAANPTSRLVTSSEGGDHLMNDVGADHGNNYNKYDHRKLQLVSGSNKDNIIDGAEQNDLPNRIHVADFVRLKELDLVQKIGVVHADRERKGSRFEFNLGGGGGGVDIEVDLTLKL